MKVAWASNERQTANRGFKVLPGGEAKQIRGTVLMVTAPNVALEADGARIIL